MYLVTVDGNFEGLALVVSVASRILVACWLITAFDIPTLTQELLLQSKADDILNTSDCKLLTWEQSSSSNSCVQFKQPFLHIQVHSCYFQLQVYL